MTLLIPLGLLGLLGIGVLILIYIIRPNYQQKFISSTYVWKLSLKYRKKKIPVSKLRNILLIICQVLILTILALLLAQPAQSLRMQIEGQEVIAIIDSSASMRAKNGDETRFERAVKEVGTLCDGILAKNGTVSVIMAESTPSFLMNAQRITSDGRDRLSEALEDLIDDGDGNMACSYGESDLNGALNYCSDMLLENPSALVYVYTDTSFSYVPQSVNVVNVAKEDEWNVAILDAKAEIVENYYTFTVTVACYGKVTSLDLNLSVDGANGGGDDVGFKYDFSEPVFFDGEGTKTVIFKNSDQAGQDITDENTIYHYLDKGALGANGRIYSYDSVRFSFDADDSFPEDDNFYIYGGQKELLRLQYVSSAPNPFMNAIFLNWREKTFADRWNIEIKRVNLELEEEYVLEGFDIYVFEHQMPEKMPTDGIVFLFDPDRAPVGSGITVGQVYPITGPGSDGGPLQAEESSPIMNYVVPEEILVTQHTRINTFESNYQELMSCNNMPSLLVKKDGAEQVVVMPFSLHYSTLPMSPRFAILMNNIFNYFLQPTVEKNSFGVNESITLNSRGENLTLRSGTENETTFEEFPAKTALKIPGTYELTQITYFDKEITERIYVRIAAAESNIHKTEESLVNPYTVQDNRSFFKDLAVYFAGALVVLLLVEWWLKGRDNI